MSGSQKLLWKGATEFNKKTSRISHKRQCDFHSVLELSNISKHLGQKLLPEVSRQMTESTKKNLESTWKGQSWSKQKKEWNFSPRDPKAVQSRDNQKSEVKRAAWSESRNPSNTGNKQSFSKGRRSSGRDVCCEACLNRQQHRWEAEGWLPEGAAGSEWCRIMTSCFGNVFSSYYFWLKIH